jgi:hypothetical protein
MRHLVIAAAVTIALGLGGAIAWQANAAGAAGAMPAGTPARVEKPIEPAACRGGGPHCPPGYHWVCGPNRCWCAPC